MGEFPEEIQKVQYPLKKEKIKISYASNKVDNWLIG